MIHSYEIQFNSPKGAVEKLIVMASSRTHALLSVQELFPSWQVLAVRREGEW